MLIPCCSFGAAEFWPGTAYDASIPTLEKVVGHAPGERITAPAEIVRYFESLAAAQPNRIKVWDYAKSWERRRLVYAAIGSEANIKRLPEIKAAMQKLADPRKTTDAEARKLMASLPALVWLGYGVHGNEISSSDAAALTAYHLLAARKNPVVEAILKDVVLLIDPLQNPDGRARFVHHFEQSEGLEADASQAALEHVEPWLNGRTNHYHFDLNRDWFALTQPETRGRVKTLLEWFPLVFVDLHEMGPDSTYYFAPEADPFNPHLTPNQRTSLDWFGKNNSKWFDQLGFSYFTREVYDAFYPGYGASWPAYYGAIAMTYEQASARGLIVRKSDETTFSYRDTVRQHFVSSVSTCETAARYRSQLFEDFWNYRKTAIEEGTKESTREYLLPRRGDVGAVDKLAELLAAQGIEVHRLKDHYAIPLNQPMKRMIRTLLDPTVNMGEAFLKEQERRRKKRLPDEIYDVTAWSIPLLYNVDLIASPQLTKLETVTAVLAPPAKASVAYLVPWGTQSASRLLASALRLGIRVHSTDKEFTQNGREFPGGTLILKVKENAESIHEEVRKLASGSGAEIVATDTGWVEDGVNFGSRYVVSMRKPVVAIAWDTPVSTASAGHARFVLERQYGYPTTPVRTNTLGTADLSRFQVLILPDGAYPVPLLRRLKEFVTNGGTLVAIGGAVSSLADPKEGFLKVSRENLPGETKKPPQEPAIAGTLLGSEAEYAKAIAPETAIPDDVQGVLLKARTDPDHWLTAGAAPIVQAMVTGRNVFTPIKLDHGVNAAVFLGPNELHASGYLWEENRKLLAYKPLVIYQREGRGHVIGFTSDPNYRGFLDGMNTLFLNAVFRGPAHAR